VVLAAVAVEVLAASPVTAAAYLVYIALRTVSALPTSVL